MPHTRHTTPSGEVPLTTSNSKVMEGNIQLRWTSHQPTIFNIFQNLLSSECLVDVTLAVEGKYLRAHKIILSACSPYFQELLSLDCSKHPIIFMSSDTKFKDLRAILDYMYKGETDIHHEELPALLKLAELLQVRGLAETGTEHNNPSPAPLVSPRRSQCHEPIPAVISQHSQQSREIPNSIGLEENSSNDQHRPSHSQRVPIPTTLPQKMPMRSNLRYSNEPSFFHGGIGIGNIPISSTSTSTNPYKRARRDIPQSSISSTHAMPQIVNQSNIEEITTTPIPIPAQLDIERTSAVTSPYETTEPMFCREGLGNQTDGNLFQHAHHPSELVEVKTEEGLANEDVEVIDDSDSSKPAGDQSGGTFDQSGSNEEQSQNWNPPPLGSLASLAGDFLSAPSSHSSTRDSEESALEPLIGFTSRFFRR